MRSYAVEASRRSMTLRFTAGRCRSYQDAGDGAAAVGDGVGRPPRSWTGIAGSMPSK